MAEQTREDQTKAKEGSDESSSGSGVGSRGSDSVANGAKGPVSAGRSSSRQINVASSFWTVLAIAGLIALLSIIAGKFKEGVIIALLIYLVVGAIFPPLAIGLGAVVLVWSFYSYGAMTTLGNWIASVTQTKAPQMSPKYQPKMTQ